MLDLLYALKQTDETMTGEVCIACRGLLSSRSYFQRATISLYQCDACGSLTALPRPSVSKQSALHDNSDYHEHPYFEQRRSSAEGIERRCRAAFDQIGRGVDLNSLRGERHLDVGCDTGSFLLASAKMLGTVPVGLDIAHRSVKEASRRGIEAYHCALETAPSIISNLSVITAIDLIEHVVDPGMFLAEVTRRLRPGGVCYLETPNVDSYVFRIGRTLARVSGGHPSWVFERLFPTEHIQYFSQAGFRTLAQQAGLEVVSLTTRPLPFADIAASLPVRTAMSAMQTTDAISGQHILICMVVRRPK
jgi:2-polyprenyl-3-methyl-5-hydroxy-6-metoxy-1,4-benzoquinol methylase